MSKPAQGNGKTRDPACPGDEAPLYRVDLATGRLVRAPDDGPCPPSTTYEAYVDMVTGDLAKSLKGERRSKEVLHNIDKLGGVLEIYGDIPEYQAQATHPSNGQAMPDAGESVLKAVRTSPLANEVKTFDVRKLEEDVADARFSQQARDSFDAIARRFDNNAASREQAIHGTVREFVGGIESLLPRNRHLKRTLQPAIDLTAEPAKKRAQTRKDRDKVRKEALEEAKPPAPPLPAEEPRPGPPAPPPPIVNPTPAAPPAAPAARARRTRSR